MKNLLLSFVFLLLIFSYSYVFYQNFHFDKLQHESFYYFAGSFLLFFLLINKYVKNDNFWLTYRHETIHSLFTVLTFNKPIGLNAFKGEGSAHYMGRPNMWIVLSPYFFPLLSLLLIIISLLFSKPSNLFYAFLGVFYAIDIVAVKKDIYSDQSDLKKYPFLINAVFVVFNWIFYLGIVFFYVTGNSKAMLHFIKEGITVLFNFIMNLIF